MTKEIFEQTWLRIDVQNIQLVNQAFLGWIIDRTLYLKPGMRHHFCNTRSNSLEAKYSTGLASVE